MEEADKQEDLTPCPQDEESDQEEPDPRVKDELENLNQTSAEVNRLENELDEARAKYRMTFAEASHKMAIVAKDKKRSIQKAREYYELREEAKKVQSESLKSARQYQSAIGVYRAAKETVALAEERLLQGGEVQLTSAWQEMLNHATIRVMEAEREKRMSEEKHMKTTSRWRVLEHRTQLLERTFKRAIANARGYFEMKQQLDLKLQQQKQNVLDLQQAIKGYKTKYADALRNLEEISESIHESRRQNLILMFPRQPGVGAESDVSENFSELTLDKGEERQVWESDDESYDEDVCQKTPLPSRGSFGSNLSNESLTSEQLPVSSHDDVTRADTSRLYSCRDNSENMVSESQTANTEQGNIEKGQIDTEEESSSYVGGDIRRDVDDIHQPNKYKNDSKTGAIQKERKTKTVEGCKRKMECVLNVTSLPEI